jgi:hypothetical protein
MQSLQFPTVFTILILQHGFLVLVASMFVVECKTDGLAETSPQAEPGVDLAEARRSQRRLAKAHLSQGKSILRWDTIEHLMLGHAPQTQLSACKGVPKTCMSFNDVLLSEGKHLERLLSCGCAPWAVRLYPSCCGSPTGCFDWILPARWLTHC